jgi:protein-S-isoprenylcysteine O-methyltransferase Ste14
MILRDHLTQLGGKLFRYRSFLPLVILPGFLAAYGDFSYPFGSHLLDFLWEMLCISIAFIGLTIRILTVGFAPAGTSGRNTKIQTAEHLNTTGMYSLVRHPLYLGNLLIVIGAVLFFRSWWFPLLVLTVFVIYYERIMLVEEQFLQEKFGKLFADWAAKTPAIIPRPSLWKRPDMSFCWRTAVRREYHGFVAILMIFTFLEVWGDFIISGKFSIEPAWVAIFLFGMATYIVIRILVKFTKVLRVQGRY